MSESVKQLVIVGGGFGGLETAKRLANTAINITLIDRSNHHLFQPLLYQVATAGLSPADIAMPIRHVLRQQKNVEVIMTEVTGVDVAGRKVITARGAYPFDYLVLATGARHGYFNHPDWEAHAPGLKSIADATQIRSKILQAFELAEMEPEASQRRALLTYVLVGGGPTGVEMAGAIAELAQRALQSDFRRIRNERANVILIEAGPRLLASFPPNLAAKAVRSLLNLGVSVRLNCRVEAVMSTSVRLRNAQGGEESIAAATIIWAAGVHASAAGEWLQASLGPQVQLDAVGRVVVSPDLSVAAAPQIYVIGDTALVRTSAGGALPGVCPVAVQQGRFVAKQIMARCHGKTAQSVFRYLDKGNLATIGRAAAVADFGWLRLSGYPAWLLWMGVHIFFLIGFRNRLLVLIQWAWAYVTFQRGARLITKTLE